MPKKRAPIIDILAYFETADLPLADQAYTLVRATMARRRTNPNPQRAIDAAKRSHHKRREPQDVPLPGMQSEVGG